MHPSTHGECRHDNSHSNHGDCEEWCSMKRQTIECMYARYGSGMAKGGCGLAA